MTRKKSMIITVLAVASLVNILMIYHTARLLSSNAYSMSSSTGRKKAQNSRESDAFRDLRDHDFAAVNMPSRNLTRQLELQKSVIAFLSQQIINNHNFTYINNPVNTCSPENMKVLFVVPSAPNNFENRERVRNGSRGRYVQESKNQAKLLFFLGTRQSNASDDVQLKVNEEALAYKDIVQDGFEDSYRNMRLKAVSMLKWASTFCGQAKYVIRTDDDVQVNPEKLVAAMDRKSLVFNEFIVGHIAAKWEPIRIADNKYFLSQEEYPYSTLPPFVLGGLLGYPMSTVKLLYQAALRIKPLWLDDVYITAICSEKVHVPLVDDPDFEFKHWAW